MSQKANIWSTSNWDYLDANNSGLINYDTAIDMKQVNSDGSKPENPGLSPNTMLGNHDWTNLIIPEEGSTHYFYSKERRGVVITGSHRYIKIRTAIPIDEQTVYHVKVRVKKIVGTGSFSCGVDTLDGDYNSLKTDQNTYNFCTAINQSPTIGESVTYQGRISGYNQPNEASHNKFDPYGSFFNIIIATEINAQSDNGEYVIEMIEVGTAASSGGGGVVFQTLAERDNYPEGALFIGFQCFVVSENMPFYYLGNGRWLEGTSNATVHIGPDAPADKSKLWIDNADEEHEEMVNNEPVLDAIREKFKEVDNKINDIYYTFNYEMDAGYFRDKVPGIDEEEEGVTRAIDNPFPPLQEGETLLPEDYDPQMSNGAAGNVERMCQKRGLKQDLEPLADGELGYCIDSQELFIGNRGKFDLVGKVGGFSGGGSGNITAEYIQLTSPNKKKFKVTVSDFGELVVYDAAIDDAPDAKPEDAVNFAGLIVNQIYGGGLKNSNDTSVSHSFIELYNNTDKQLNLKGLSLQYAENLRPWQAFPLKGLIPPFSSFLIRGSQHSNPDLNSVRLPIRKYDMSWDIPFSDKGMKVFLRAGSEACTVANPFDIDGKGTKLPGYIDMLSAAGKDKLRPVDGYEKAAAHLMDKNTAVHRKDFADTNNNAVDARAIDYRAADPLIYGPRTSRDGQWNVYFDKIKLDPSRPNLLGMTFGKNASNSRCFTWQSVPTEKGYIMYKLQSESNWRPAVPSEKIYYQHYDCDSTVHKVVLENLTAGIYIYKAGEEGKWSDEYTFEVKAYGDRTPFKFCQITDQQGWNEHEYKAWGVAHKGIRKYESGYDFYINTGDISQNANRSFEWRYYWKEAESDLASTVQMASIGNNDLVDKKSSEMFNYYFTHPESTIPSVYSYDVGMVHFVSLNSHDLPTIPAQIEWLRADLTAAQARPGRRWTIVHIHLAPYTVGINSKQLPFAPIFEEFNVELVICGHNHCYSRSLPIRDGAVVGTWPDNTKLTTVAPVYAMSQATGYKLSGKEKPVPGTFFYAKATVPNQPSYIMWEVTYEKIIMKAYKLDGIILPEDVIGDDPIRAAEYIDYMELTHL